MTENTGQPSGTLLLRAWVEEGRPDGLRVRVIRIHQSGTTSTVSAGRAAATCEIVAAWLNELLTEGTAPPLPFAGVTSERLPHAPLWDASW